MNRAAKTHFPTCLRIFHRTPVTMFLLPFLRPRWGRSGVHDDPGQPESRGLEEAEELVLGSLSPTVDDEYRQVREIAKHQFVAWQQDSLHDRQNTARLT